LNTFKDYNWYKSKGIPHHLTLLLKGDPGTGKTSFIKCMSKFFDKNVFYVDIGKIKTKKDFRNIIVAKYNSIIIFEDFDRLNCVLTDNKENKTEEKIVGVTSKLVDTIYNSYLNEKDIEKKESLFNKYKEYVEEETEKLNDKLDLPFILNTIDGIMEYPSRIIIMTCNFPERLAKALLRPGRIDFEIEFKRCNRLIIGQILTHFYDIKNIPNLNKIEEYKYTAAEISALCKIHYDNIDIVVSKLVAGINNIESNVL
jgi:chaperone BCS1